MKQSSEFFFKNLKTQKKLQVFDHVKNVFGTVLILRLNQVRNIKTYI